MKREFYDMLAWYTGAYMKHDPDWGRLVQSFRALCPPNTRRRQLYRTFFLPSGELGLLLKDMDHKVLTGRPGQVVQSWTTDPDFARRFLETKWGIPKGLSPLMVGYMASGEVLGDVRGVISGIRRNAPPRFLESRPNHKGWPDRIPFASTWDGHLEHLDGYVEEKEVTLWLPGPIRVNHLEVPDGILGSVTWEVKKSRSFLDKILRR